MRRWRLWPILVVLLVANYWAASTVPDKPSRARIAYSPQFLSEVKANNVRLVTITEQNIEGEFKRPVTIEKKKFTRFSTNQPALPTDDTLLALLKTRSVEINAKSPDSGRGLLGQMLLGFGPTLLILAIIIFAMRRASAGGGPERARPLAARSATRAASGSRSTTSPASRRPRRSSSRSSTSSRTPTKYRRSGARSRAAYCSPARREPARRCSRAPSPARPACRSSRSAPPSSSR